MKSHILSFVDFSGQPELVESLKQCLDHVHPRFIRWLRKATISEKTVDLLYNINPPTRRWLEKELEPLLRAAGLPVAISANYIRPAILHPKAVSTFEAVKERLIAAPRDLSWISRDDIPAVYYLHQYRFLRLNYEFDVLGFDASCSNIVSKTWVDSVEVTEEEGQEFLRTWL